MDTQILWWPFGSHFVWQSADHFICGPWVCAGLCRLWIMSMQSTNMSRHVQRLLWCVFNCRWDNIVLISLFEQSEWCLWFCLCVYVFSMAFTSTCGDEFRVWVHVYIYVAMQAHISLHLCLGFPVYLSVSLLRSLFFSKPVSHRVGTRDDLSEQVWDGKDEISTEYTILWRAVIAITCYSGLLEEAQLGLYATSYSHTCWKRNTCQCVPSFSPNRNINVHTHPCTSIIMGMLCWLHLFHHALMVLHVLAHLLQMYCWPGCHRFSHSHGQPLVSIHFRTAWKSICKDLKHAWEYHNVNSALFSVTCVTVLWWSYGRQKVFLKSFLLVLISTSERTWHLRFQSF